MLLLLLWPRNPELCGGHVERGSYRLQDLFRHLGIIHSSGQHQRANHAGASSQRLSALRLSSSPRDYPGQHFDERPKSFGDGVPTSPLVPVA